MPNAERIRGTLLGLILLNDPTYCYAGPGKPYLYKYSLHPKYPIDVFGRAETFYGPWLLVNQSPPDDFTTGPCWMDATGLDLTMEQMDGLPEEPVDKILPHDNISLGKRIPPIKWDEPLRAGEWINVNWYFHDVGPGEIEDPNRPRYLIEAWVCRDGRIQFVPSGWPQPWDIASTYPEDYYPVTAFIQDEPGCSEQSHARLYLAWKHGYTDPVDLLPWPPANQPAQPPTPTP